MKKCIDKEGHEWTFVGYMVVANDLSPKGTIPKSSIGGTTMSCGVPVVKVPVHFEAKIEVWQCGKCGWVSLKPAVFSRLE